MSEEKSSLFKFKKASKVVGGIDINNENEYDFLVKDRPYDLPEFLHIRKKWLLTEVPEVKDADGNITTKGISHEPAFQAVLGFIKDGKYITTKDRTYAKGTFHEIQKTYASFIKSMVEEHGFNLDDNASGIPLYYANEKSAPMDFSGNLSSAMQSIQQSVVAPATQPQSTTRRPHKFLSGILRSAQANSNPNP